MGVFIEYLNLGETYDHQPADNTAAIVTLTAPDVSKYAGRGWVLGGIAWSYDDTPTGGNLSITNGGTTAFSMDITTGGAGFIPFIPPLRANSNADVVVTLAAGGAGIAGKVNVLGARIII